MRKNLKAIHKIIDMLYENSNHPHYQFACQVMEVAVKPYCKYGLLIDWKNSPHIDLFEYLCMAEITIYMPEVILEHCKKMLMIIFMEK